MQREECLWKLGGVLARPGFLVPITEMKFRVVFCDPGNAFSSNQWAGKEGAQRAVSFSAVCWSCTYKQSRSPIPIIPAPAGKAHLALLRHSLWVNGWEAAEMPSRNWQLLLSVWFLQLQWTALGHLHKTQTLLKMIQSKGSDMTSYFFFSFFLCSFFFFFFLIPWVSEHAVQDKAR